MVKQVTKLTMSSQSGGVISIRGLSTSHNLKYLEISYEGVSAVVELAGFASDNANPIRQELVRKGAMIVDPADWRKVISAVAKIKQFESASLVTRPGWCENGFVLLNGKVISRPKGDMLVSFKAEPQAFTKGGSAAAWKREVAERLTEQAIPIFAIMVGLAAPLLSIVGDQLNLGFEIRGPKGRGKSTCQALSVSVAGPITDKLTFNSTINGFEPQFHRFNDMPMIIDETKTQNYPAADIENFIFRMALGAKRLNAHHSEIETFRFIFLTSANETLTSVLPKGSPSTEAALDRYFSICIPSEPLGVFSFLPEGVVSAKAFATELADAAGTNYGWALPKLVKFLGKARAASAEELRGRVRNLVRDFETMVGIAASVEGGSRASAAFGLVAAAGILAQEAGVLPKNWDCSKAALECYRNHLQQSPNPTPLIVSLTEIMERPQTLEIKSGEMQNRSDQELSDIGVFYKISPTGDLKIMVTSSVRDNYLNHWTVLKNTPDFLAWNKREKDHETIQRKIRKNSTKDRVYCFHLPAGHPLALKFAKRSSS